MANMIQLTIEIGGADEKETHFPEGVKVRDVVNSNVGLPSAGSGSYLVNGSVATLDTELRTGDVIAYSPKSGTQG